MKVKMRRLTAVLTALAGFGGCWLGLAMSRVLDTGAQVGVASVPLVVALAVLGPWAEHAREKKKDPDAPGGMVSATMKDSPGGQAIGQVGPGGVVLGPNSVFNLGRENERGNSSASKQKEDPPKLKLRLVPFDGQSHQGACRLEAKIISSEPLMNIVIILPYGDKRITGGGNWLQTRHFGDSLLQPGRWLPFEGIVHLTSQAPTGKLEAMANFRGEYGERWENIFVEISFPEPPG